MGTNNRAEVIALWGALNFANWLGLENIFVHGDAKSSIDWVKDYTLFYSHILSNWMSRITLLTSASQNITYTHIYREHNQVVDLISKRGID